VPYLLSFAGLSIARKYVKNWYLLIPVYIGIVSKTVAEFRDGKSIPVSKSDYGEFREKLFQLYLRDNGFTYFIRNGRTLVETDNAVKMYMLPNYSNVLDEIYLKKAYGNKRLDGRPVIDVGASIGDSSLYFAKLGASEVHGFELDSERYAMAIENIQINNMTQLVHIYNTRASSKNIASLIEENQLSNLFMKLDCEGCEYDVVLNLPEETYTRITDIVMEYHKNPKPIMKRLSRLGYKVNTFKRFLVREGLIKASR
jgi:hypothetical protein